MRNEEVVDAIQEYHEKRIETLEGHVSVLNREMGEVKGAVDGLVTVMEGNRFWLKVVGISTPGAVIGLWVLDQFLKRLGS